MKYDVIYKNHKMKGGRVKKGDLKIQVRWEIYSKPRKPSIMTNPMTGEEFEYYGR